MNEARMRPPGELSNRELWRWRVAQTPERRWLWFEGRTWSYGEFDVEIRRLAAGLRELGVQGGTRVLIGMGNRPETIQAQLAVGFLGAVCVPLLPGNPIDELAFPINHSEAAILIAEEPIASQVAAERATVPAVERLVLLTDADIAAIDGAVRFEDVAATAPMESAPLEGDDLHANAHIVYTSGSTGRPKGVMLRRGSLYSCGLGYADLYGFTTDDIYFHPLTFAHSLGAIAALGIPMLTGGSVAISQRFRPSTFWADIEASGATISVLFPAHLNLLVETDDGSVPAGSTSLRYVVTHADTPAFRDRFGVELGTIWGMSETVVCAGSDPGYRGELGPGYVGHAFAGGEVGIFDPDTLERRPPYEYGELWLRHPQVMLGYLKDPDATAATVVDGWIRSGDRGFMDNSGRAYFAGRYKAMIKRSGENISSEEVELVLGGHADVAECVVFAVPDRLRTEEVGVVVVRASGGEADPAALRAAASAELVRWKLPRYVLVVDEALPRLGNGKIDRVSVAAMLDPDTAWDAEAQAPARPASST